MVAPSRKDEIAVQVRAILAAREAAKRKALPSSWQREYGIAALGREARRRGTTYGKLVSLLTSAEQEEIVRNFAEERRSKKKR